VFHSEIDKIIASKKSIDRINSIKSVLIAAISVLLSYIFICVLFPQILIAQNRMPPMEKIGGYLNLLFIICAVGSAFVPFLMGRNYLSNISKSLILAITFISLGFIVISFSRIFHVRSLDFIWAFWVFLGYMTQSLLTGYVTRSTLIAVPSEKVLRFADRLKARVISLEDIGKEQFNAIAFDSSASHSPDWNYFLSRASLEGFRLIDVSQLYEEQLGRVHYGDVSYIFRSSGDHHQQLYQPLKSFVEYCLVIATLPLWLTVLVIAMIAVKLEDGGSIFFNQKRMGKFGQEFTMFKLRSMREISEAPSTPTRSDDDRVTRIGRVIRKYRIDEIPQLFNVLRGEMSLIGPRADWRLAEQFFDDLTIYHLRHLVKPGITGWAQVRQGYVSTTQANREKLEYDLYYVKHMGPVLDVVIFIRTLGIIFSGFGSR